MSLIDYDQAVSAHQNKRRGRAFLIPIKGLNSSLTTYNCAPMVNDNKILHLLSRVESSDPGSEISDVRGFYFDRRGFVVPNGLIIPKAQDPSTSLIAPDRTVIGVVAITENQGKIATYWSQLYEFKGGVVSQDRIARGLEFQKEVRVAYVGSFGEEDLSVIATRERQDNARRIRSYLQVGIVPTATDMLQLSRDIIQVKNDPTSRLDVLLPDNLTWFGPNQIIPLQSQDGDLVFGLLFHTGRFTNRLYGNGEKGRNYIAWVTEISADPETRQVTSFTKPRVIATADIFPYTEAKRSDLFNVIIPGGFVFGMKKGLVEQTILFGGLRDRYNCWAEMGYPFSRPPDLKLNRLS
ncbi:MAG: DUF1861 family protein, partial [Candidatus Daviesbacteria bacterium]|nr:DUF1861 family protein [Candidatus Daviesbacteria bacterium]